MTDPSDPATVAALSRSLQRQYDRNLNRDLARQQYQDLLYRNVLLTLDQVYAQARQDWRGQSGSDALSRYIEAYQGLTDEFLQYVLHKHRTSCAISNFPTEHNPSQAYVERVLTEVQLALRNLQSSLEL